MVTQSQAPTLLLTRPEAQSQRFAAMVQDVLGPLPIIVSPLMSPQFADPDLAGRPYQAVILTSETAVQAARRISALGHLLPSLAYCVGARTAQAARQAGFIVVSADGDAQALIALIQSENPAGPLLHLRGADTRGDVAETLTMGGIVTDFVIAYSQNPEPLSAKAVQAIQQSAPLILPIFSPRSAQLVAYALPADPKSPFWVAAISPAVAQAAQALAPARVLVAARPDAESMLHAVADLISLVRGA